MLIANNSGTLFQPALQFLSSAVNMPSEYFGYITLNYRYLSINCCHRNNQRLGKKLAKSVKTGTHIGI